MNDYILYGLHLRSDLDFFQLPMLPEKAQNAPVITIQEMELPKEMQSVTGNGYEFGKKLSWISNNTAWIFAIRGEKIGYKLKTGGNPQYLQTYLLGWGMSMLALQRGILAIHCSALADEQGAVLISGESGAGKSTLTGYLLKNGYRFMADDMVFAEPEKEGKPMAYPGFPYQKLCRNEVTAQGLELEKLRYINEDKDKFLVPYQGEFSTDPVKIKAIVYLVQSGAEQVECRRLSGLEGFQVIADNLFLRKLLKKDRYRPEIGKIAIEIAAQVPVLMVERPETGNTVIQIAEKVMEFLHDLDCESLK